METNVNSIIEETEWNTTRALIAQINQEREDRGKGKINPAPVRATIDTISIVLSQEGYIIIPD